MTDQDRDAIDKIADILAAPEWSGADFLEAIANVIGTVRPHPGGYATRTAYAKVFLEKTGRDVIDRGEEVEKIHLVLEIDNDYEDGVSIATHVEAEVDHPRDWNCDVTDDDALNDWAREVLFDYTGAERYAGNDEGLERTPDAIYTVKIKSSPDEPALVGKEFELGG